MSKPEVAQKFDLIGSPEQPSVPSTAQRQVYDFPNAQLNHGNKEQLPPFLDFGAAGNNSRLAALGDGPPFGKAENQNGALKGREREPQQVSDARNLATEMGETFDVHKVLARGLAEAYRQYGGDRAKFAAFGQALTQELKERGIVMRMEGSSIGLHTEGSSVGVEFKLSGKRDAETGQMSDVQLKTQGYDWQSKQDIQMTDSRLRRVIDQLGMDTDTNRRDQLANGFVRDGLELAQEFSAARNKGDFAAFNRDLARSLAYAHENGGMEAVKKLISAINQGDGKHDLAAAIAGDTRNMTPLLVAFEDQGSLKIFQGHTLMGQAERLAARMTAQQLAAERIYKNPIGGFGFIELLDEKPRIVKLPPQQVDK